MRTDGSEVEAFKQRQRAVWALGDHALIARRLEPVANELVACTGARTNQV